MLAMVTITRIVSPGHPLWHTRHTDGTECHSIKSNLTINIFNLENVFFVVKNIGLLNNYIYIYIYIHTHDPRLQEANRSRKTNDISKRPAGTHTRCQWDFVS